MFIRDKPVVTQNILTFPFGEMPLVGEIDSFVEFSCTPRVNAVGAWSIKIPAHLEQAEMISPGRGVVVFLEDQSTPIFSGPIRQIKRTWSKDEAGQGMILANGPCDNVLFDERVGRANPGRPFSEESAETSSYPPVYDHLDWEPLVWDANGDFREPTNTPEFL